jgi:hypothetical protein
MAKFADTCPIRYPDKNSGQSHKDGQRDDQHHASSGFGVLIGPLRDAKNQREHRRDD